jgi:hypothetical protein
VPEVPGLVIEDSGRRAAKGIAKCVIAQEGPCGANVLGGSERHELAEQALAARERLGGGLPPDVPLGQLGEKLAAQVPIISSAIKSGRRCGGRHPPVTGPAASMAKRRVSIWPGLVRC